MKSLFQINTIVNASGTGRIVEDIGRMVISKNWKSTIAYGLKSALGASEMIRIGNNCDIYHHAIETRLLDNHAFSSRSATRVLIKQLEASRPSIIHLHNLHGYYLNIRSLFDYLSKTDIPIVWTLHDCWSFTGHCCHFTYVKCDRWMKGCYDCPQQRIYPASLLCDRSKKNYEEKKELFNSIRNLTIVTVSKWLEGVVQQSFLNNYPIKMFRNGIDLNAFKKNENSDIIKQFGLEGKQIILGCCNGWDIRKGYDDFIRLNKYIDKHQQIILIGLTKEQIRKLPSGMIGIERTGSKDELASFYSVADVFLNLSIEETFGLVTAEAMACGTPVIVYNSTASPELVSPETGRVVEVGDIEAVIFAIRELTSANRKSLRESCRNRTEQLYNKDINFKQYMELYEQISN